MTVLNDEVLQVGEYGHLGTWAGDPYLPVQKLNKPISPKENIRCYMDGGKYLWIPNLGTDSLCIAPEHNRDIAACGYEGGIDAFGVRWIPNASTKDLPAFVEPGFVILDDIKQWETLVFPTINEWHLEEEGERYRVFYEGDDRYVRGEIYTGFFERLVALMGFEEAAIAIYEQTSDVAAFFDELANFNIELVDHYVDDFACDAIVLHDDWGSQQAPFFSLGIAMEALVGPMRRVVSHAHERGVSFIHHCCGNNVALIPALKATGADVWQAQVNAIDVSTALGAIDASFVLELYPVLPPDLPEEGLLELISSFFALADGNRVLLNLVETNPERSFETHRIAYEIGRAMVYGRDY